MKTIHGSHSTISLSFTGTWVMQGPQPVGKAGGVPQYVADIFERDFTIQQVAISRNESGVVWSRMEGIKTLAEKKIDYSQLGYATTGELIEELRARCVVDGSIDYKSVG